MLEKRVPHLCILCEKFYWEIFVQGRIALAGDLLQGLRIIREIW